MVWLARDMERTREARRSAIVASNGVSRRRQRTSEDGRVEMQERARLRDRPGKKDRDLVNRSKRRKGDNLTRRNHREEEDEGSEESLVEEDEYGSTRPSPRSPASSQQIHCKNSLSSRSVRQAGPALKVVAVPRKARSASVKRSHEHWTSSCEDRLTSASPGSHSFEAGSPSSSNVSVKQRTKPTESRAPLLSQPNHSGSAQEDLEIEIAEVLGLMKQSRGSKKEANAEVSGKTSEINDTSATSREAKLSSDPSNGSESKMQKMEAEDISGHNEKRYSETSAVKIEAEIYPKLDTCALKSGRFAEAAPASMEPQDEIVKKEESDVLMKESEHRELASSAKLDADRQELEMIITGSKTQDHCPREKKFQIDLMASPSMPSSPERANASGQMASDPEAVGQMSDKEDEKGSVEKERVEDGREKKMENGDFLKLDLEMPSRSGVSDGSIKILNQVLRQNQQQHQVLVKAPLPKVEKNGSAQPGCGPLPVGGWPSGVHPVGYMAPFQAIAPVDGTPSGPSKASPAAPVMPSQPRPKRCATHFYIARNIQFHQQFMKTNRFLPPSSVSSPSYTGLRSNNLYAAPPTESLIHENLSQGNFPVSNQNTAQDKGASLTETSQSKQLVLQQAPQPPPATSANIMPGATFILPMNHQPQRQTVAAANQSTSSKSVPSSGNASLPSHSKSGVSALSFNYSNSASSEAPYLTILPNTGYPYPISVPAGTQQAARGLGSAQALPFFNTSFYSSQIFHSPQFQHQQQAHQNTNALKSSQGGTHVGGNTFLNMNGAQKQQSQKQHLSSSNQSHRVDAEKNAYGQSLTVPVQPWNFALMPNIHQSEKHQNAQQNLPQAFAMSFASSSSLNFSSAANGYPIVAASQVNQKKQEGKNGCGLIFSDDGRKVAAGKSTGQTLVFDNSSRTLSFVSSPIAGNWPRPVSTSSVPTGAAIQIPTGRSKAMTANTTLPVSSIAIKFHNNSSAQPSQWKNSMRNSAPQAPPSLGACNAPNVKNIQQQHGRASQGQTQISFAVNSEAPSNSQAYSSPLVIGSPPPHGAGKNNSKAKSTTSDKTGSSAHTTTQSQQTENLSAGAGQKSSPVCGRNVPSIISSCPSHLSELKY